MFIAKGCTSEFFERNEIHLVLLAAGGENVDGAIDLSPPARRDPEEQFVNKGLPG